MLTFGLLIDLRFFRELSFATKLQGMKLRSANCSITCTDLLLWCSTMSLSKDCIRGNWKTKGTKYVSNTKARDLGDDVSSVKARSNDKRWTN